MRESQQKKADLGKIEIIETPEYIVEMATLITALTAKVSTRMANGYVPLGAPFIWKEYICQALTRK